MNILFINFGKVIYTWTGDIDLQMLMTSKEIIIAEQCYQFENSELDFDRNEYRITLKHLGTKYY